MKLIFSILILTLVNKNQQAFLLSNYSYWIT
jgi:hypothetical protein